MQTQRMGGVRLKGFGVLLLLVFLLVCSNFDACEARRRRHWRAKRLPSVSSIVARKKGRGKSGGGSGSGSGSHQSGGGLSSPSPAPAPAPSPPLPPPPPPAAPAPSPSSAKASPSTPAKASRSAPAKPSLSHPPKPSPSHPPKPSPSPPAKPSPSPPAKPSPSTPARPSPSASAKPSPSASAKPSPSPPAKPSPSPPAKPSPSASKPNPSPCPKATPSPAPAPATFDVLKFGAKGDGATDDTKAFQAAWAEACKAGSSAVVVPEGYTYLVGPISFSGPYCQPNIVFQLDGTIIAPTSAKPWGPGILQWLEFTKLRGITIQGSGTIEGRGSVWWTNPASDVDPINIELTTTMPSIKPTALRFYGSYNVTVTGITIQNSPQCHLKFDNCEDVEVFNLTVASPGDSLNTDGIHLQNSRDVLIHQTDMACGDDCVSIQTGCSNVYIHNVNCGPGHGISIGGLGRDNTKACVSNITVRDVNMHNTMTGVRIKTWQGGSGLVQNVRFSNIRVSEVQMPIVIDQFYCDRSSCKNQTSAVALSGIAYENIRGTYTVKPMHFACSEDYPCSDISLTQVALQPLQERYHMYEPFCWHAFGELYTPTVPPIACLQNGKPNSNRIQSDHDSC